MQQHRHILRGRVVKEHTDNNISPAKNALRRVLRSGGAPTTKSETIHEDLLLSKHTVIRRKKQKRNCVDQDVRVSSREDCELFKPNSEIEELRKFMHTVSRLRILLGDVAALEEVCSRYPRLEKVEEWEDCDTVHIHSTINTLRNSIEVIKSEVHSESPRGKIRRWFTSLTLRAKEYALTVQMLRSDEEGSALQWRVCISPLDRVYTYSGWR